MILFKDVAKQLNINPSNLNNDIERAKSLYRQGLIDFTLHHHILWKIYTYPYFRDNNKFYRTKKCKFVNNPDLFMERIAILRRFRRPLIRPKMPEGYLTYNTYETCQENDLSRLKIDEPLKLEPKSFFNENFRNNLWEKYSISKIDLT